MSEFENFDLRRRDVRRVAKIDAPYVEDVFDVFKELRRSRRRQQVSAFLPYLCVALVAFPFMLWGFHAWDRIPAPAQSGARDPLRASFSNCHSGGGFNCIVDGDTFWFEGEKIRIADIDTPETHPARCLDEEERGASATRRLGELLNAGAFTLSPIDRSYDRYGRKLMVVQRGGQSIGDVLVAEGLARHYSGGFREGWCG
jgi:micrococcal nuclease